MNQDRVETNSTDLSIFLVGPSYPFRGGIAHYTTLLYSNLKKQYNTTFHSLKRQYFKFLYPGSDDKDYSDHKIDADGVKRDLDVLNPFSWAKAGLAARKYSLIILPWWVHFWVPYYLTFLLFAKTRHNRVVFICHNVEEHESNFLKKIASKILLQRGDGYILHSSEEERSLKSLLKNQNIATVISPHPTYDIFNQNRYTRLSAKKALDITPSRKVILFFGFIRKYKGLQYLLEAMPLIINRYNDILLLVVGEVWRKQIDYFNLIKELKLEQNVRFINHYVPNEDVEKYFKASDFLILPYISGTGSGILQVAYGMDTPVIATETGPFKGLIEDGKTGLLIPAADEKKLAEAIIKMYDENLGVKMEKEISKFGNKQRFDWSNMAKNIATLYNRIT